MNMKKTFIFAGGAVAVLVVGVVMGSFGAALNVNAQTAMPVQPANGFIQFNNLTVQSVSASNPPAEILATDQSIFPVIYNSPAVSGGTSVGSAAATPTTQSTVKCYRFNSQSAASGTAVTCPVPPTTTTSTATTQGVNAGTGGTTKPEPSIYPPFRYQPYRIEVDASTQLSLRDRTSATLNDFAAGDQINVFGYYNADGSIQAYLVRDLSKPVQTQTLQLNNVEIVSISGTSIPATIAVTQQQAAPCYLFDTNSIKQPYACPMGVSSFSGNAATKDVTPPAAMMPSWIALRKYVVTVDAQTILLDANRTQLSLSNLNVGDVLNVYGETTDNGQTLTADIVRDLSIPATPSTYTGTVTQVNTDGSFIIQTQNGQTITVQSPIQVGAVLQLTGLLDRLKNVLSQVTSIINAKNVVYPPLPPPLPVPMSAPAPTPATHN